MLQIPLSEFSELYFCRMIFFFLGSSLLPRYSVVPHREISNSQAGDCMVQNFLWLKKQEFLLGWIDFIVSNLKIILEDNFLLTKQITVQCKSDTFSGIKAALAALNIKSEHDLSTLTTTMDEQLCAASAAHSTRSWLGSTESFAACHESQKMKGSPFSCFCSYQSKQVRWIIDSFRISDVPLEWQMISTEQLSYSSSPKYTSKFSPTWLCL